MPNLKFQNMESAIWDVKFRVLARTSCSRFAPRSLLTAESGFKRGFKIYPSVKGEIRGNFLTQIRC
jgi:hypothetical protein